MDFRIESGSHVPIYLQIVEGVRSAITSGGLRPGEALPSLRSLGVQLRVNPNTVQRAFDELERDGLIFPRRGVGMYVAELRIHPALGRDEAAVVEAFRRGIEAGQVANISPGRLRQLFGLAVKSTTHGVGI